MNALPGPSVPTGEAVECLDCKVIFSTRSSLGCPKCASVLGLVPVETDAPAREIARLRDREAWSTAALLQIAKGLHASHHKANIAKRCLEYLAQDQHDFAKTKEAPESPDASIRKEEPIQ